MNAIHLVIPHPPTKRHLAGDANALDFACDLLSETATTDFFFTNDLRVLIDVIIRGLLDLEADHPVQNEN